MDVTTGPHGPASKSLIDWLKGIFGAAFSTSRGFSGAHDGLDLPAKEGTPVRALKSGVVSYARDARTAPDKGSSGWAIGGGNVVNIDIGGKLTTQYAHLKSIAVKPGQFVQAGQIIGTVGRTGGTTASGAPGGAGSTFSGAHLHFGLWDKNVNKMVNPQRFLEGIEASGQMGETNQTTLEGFQSLLRKLNINDSPSHVITESEAKLIAGEYGVSGSLFETIWKRFVGQTVGEAWKGHSGPSPTDLVPDIPGALTAVGQQLADTFTWIGFVLLGLVLIGGGIYLLGGRGNNG